MKTMQIGGAVALSLLLVACGEKQDARIENRQGPSAGSAVSQAGETYSAAGDVTAIVDNQITISHGAVPDAGWPAMAMTFTAERADIMAGLRPGDHVEFTFRKNGGGAVVTSISKR